MHQFQIRSLNKLDFKLDSIRDFVADFLSNLDFIESKSSGSTGKPKTIHLKKEQLRASAKMTGEFFDFKPKQKIALALPIETIGGKMLVVRALLHNMNLLVCELTRNPLQDLNETIDFIALTPMQAKVIAAESPEKFNLIKNCLLGGSKVDNELENALSGFSCQFYESFGMTETISHVAIRKLHESTNFNALNGVNFSQDARGCLCIDAPHLAVTNLQTNDIVELISNTSFHFLGRADFVINSGGLKFHPEKLEQKIHELIPYSFFFIGEKDPLYGEKIVLFIEKNAAEAEQNKLLAKIKSRLSRYEYPKNTYFVSQFDYTISGKVNRIQTQKNQQA